MVEEDLCDGCGRCVHVCMMNVIEMQETANGIKAVIINPDNCMFCEACVIDCKRIAIRLTPVAMNKNIKNISEKVLEKTDNGVHKKRKGIMKLFS